MLRNMAAYLSIALAVLRTEHRLPRLEMLEQAFKAPGTALLNKPALKGSLMTTQRVLERRYPKDGEMSPHQRIAPWA